MRFPGLKSLLRELGTDLFLDVSSDILEELKGKQVPGRYPEGKVVQGQRAAACSAVVKCGLHQSDAESAMPAFFVSPSLVSG